MVIQIYFFDIFKDFCFNGGNNVNKHLAYLALANSATDEWTAFDIDRTIVIEDFQTKVDGVFDFINNKDYSISRMNDAISIIHTDGVVMVLPSLLKKMPCSALPGLRNCLGSSISKGLLKNQAALLF